MKPAQKPAPALILRPPQRRGWDALPYWSPRHIRGGLRCQRERIAAIIASPSAVTDKEIEAAWTKIPDTLRGFYIDRVDIIMEILDAGAGAP